jgi:hypothetical protein
MNFLVIIRCPATGCEVPTGLVTDLSKLDNLPRDGADLRCPSCGRTHVWSRKDALLAHSTAALETGRLAEAAE